MSITLFDALYDVARILGGVRTGVATGGSATTLIDTNNRREQPDFWTGGTVFIKSGTYISKTRAVKSYIPNTLTFQSTLAGAIISGVKYAVAPPRFTKEVMIMGVNMALADMGRYVQTDETLTTDSTIESYDIPAGVSELKKVEVAGSDEEPYSYSPKYQWFEQKDQLVFQPGKAPTTDDYKIRLWYIGSHAEVYEDTDAIQGVVDREWLKWAAIVHIYRDIITIEHKDNIVDVELMNEAIKREETIKATMWKKLQRHMDRTPIYSGY